jgi:transposase
MNVHRSWRWPQETWGADPLTTRPNGVANIMRALDPEVVDAVWAAVETLLPVHNETHPLGCHRPRASDRSCFDAMLVRPVTGCSWEDAARLCGSVVSDTTARGRRDEWVAGRGRRAIATKATLAFDKLAGLALSEAAVDGFLHKSSAGGEGTAQIRPIGRQAPVEAVDSHRQVRHPDRLTIAGPPAMTACCSRPPSRAQPSADCSVTSRRF